MDELTANRIVEKAEFIEERVQLLSERQSLSEEEYLRDRDAQAIVERRFVTTIQACIDIAGMILKAEGERVPAQSADKLRRLVGTGVLSESLGERMAATAGLRNVLAHQYGTLIDDELVYESLQDLSRFREYLLAVRDYLASHDAL